MIPFYLTKLKSQRGSALIYFAVFALTTTTFFVLILFSYVHRQIGQANNTWQAQQAQNSVKSALAYGIEYLKKQNDQGDLIHLEYITNQIINQNKSNYTITSTNTDFHQLHFKIIYQAAENHDFPELDESGLIRLIAISCPSNVAPEQCDLQQPHALGESLLLYKRLPDNQIKLNVKSPVGVKDNLVLQGSASIVNSTGNYAITKASRARVNTRGNPDIIAHYEYPENIQSINQWDGLSPKALFQQIFDADFDQTVSAAEIITQDQLDQASGIVYIPNDVNIAGNHQIGKASDPVFLIINGDFEKGAGNISIHGYVYVTGRFHFFGNLLLYGAIFAANDFSKKANEMDGNPLIQYHEYDDIASDDQVDGVSDFFILPKSYHRLTQPVDTEFKHES